MDKMKPDQQQHVHADPLPIDFSAMIEFAPLAITVHHRGALVYVNQACRKLFALGEEQDIKKFSILDFARPEDHAEIKQRVAHIIEGEPNLGPYQLKLRRLNGRMVDTEIQVSSLNLENTQDLIQVWIQDISERKEIERAMFDAEQRYRAMAEKNPHYIFILQDGLIVFSNSSANQNLARSRPDLFHPPLPFEKLLNKNMQNIWNKNLLKLHSGQAVDPFTVELHDARQNTIPSLISLVPLDSPQLQQGNFTQVLVIAMDLSCLTTENQSLQEEDTKVSSQEELTKRNQPYQDELNAFVYAVSHDLRSPLHHISGFTDATLDEYGEQLGDDGRSYLQRVLKSVEFMTHLIDALLDLSRLSHKELTPQNIDLSGLCQAVALDLQQDPEFKDRASHRPIVMHIEKDLKLRADPDQIRQVMEKLLHNAIKFSTENNPVNIYVGRVIDQDKPMDQQTGQTFFVRDEGVGFDMKQADRLFTPFQRLHSQSDFSGLGMGLATVRRIITRHQGQVWAESSLNEGTSIFFTIPNDQD